MNLNVVSKQMFITNYVASMNDKIKDTGHYLK